MDDDPSTLRVVCSAFGDIEALTTAAGPVPVPGVGQVRVDVSAIGVGFVDALIVRGLYQVRPPLPFTPGSVVAGVVGAVGSAVTNCAVGDPVAALLSRFGGYATHVLVDAAVLVPLPIGISPVVAVTALESYGTAEFAMTERVVISPDEWVVVLGAGGGLGLAVVDVARGLGARVVAVASSEDKRSAARAAGAEVVLDYDDLKERIRAVTGGGADVVIDPVGGAAAEAGLRALRPGGRFCVLGFASGEIPRLPANLVLLANRSVIGVDWGDRARTDPRATAAKCSRLLGRIAAGELHPPTPTTFPLVEAPEALRMLADRDVTGKIALLP